MLIYDTANRLASEIRSSEEATRLRELKERVYGDETNRVLLTEFKKLQLRLAMSATSPSGMPSEDMQRFQQLSALLACNQEVQAFLLAEMQMQRIMADVFKTLNEASGVTYELPEAAQ